MSSSTEYNFISKFYKSFSGTDTLAFILFPGSNPVLLGSLTTVSYSVYRTKQPVINLGRISINGLTRGARIYAGTMIFTMINQHWLNELCDNEKLEWLSKYEELKADELPLFDLMIVSANEYGSYVSMFVYGVDITDEGQVVSVEDLFTENTLNFVARDLSTFKAGDISGYSKVVHRSNDISKVELNNFYFFDNVFDTTTKTRDAKIDKDTYMESLFRDKMEKDRQQRLELERKQRLKNFTRDLQYREFDTMVGDDVGLIQQKLREWNFISFMNYIYDSATEEGVRKFQSSTGLPITGVVDSRTYVALNSNDTTSDTRTGVVINQSGTRLYAFPNLFSSIIGTIPYNNIVEIHGKTTEESFYDYTTKENIEANGHTFYKLEQGYVVVDDIYSYEYSNKDTAFPTINLYEKGPYVTTLQELLKSVFGQFEFTPGTYDDSTIDKVKQLQMDNNISCILGVVNEETWRWLHTLTGDLATDITNSNVSIISNNPQGRYTLNSLDMNTDLFNGFDVKVSSQKSTIAKGCCIAHYDDGSTKTVTKQYDIPAKSTTTINFADFQNAFVYDIKNKWPSKVEYFVSIYNGDTYKWIINYRGE